MLLALRGFSSSHVSEAHQRVPRLTTRSRLISFDLSLVMSTSSSHGSFLALRLGLGLEDIAPVSRKWREHGNYMRVEETQGTWRKSREKHKTKDAGESCLLPALTALFPIVSVCPVCIVDTFTFTLLFTCLLH